MIDFVQDAVTWAQAAGVLGWAAFAVFFVVANTMLVPATLLAVAAGYTFGFPAAFVLCAVSRPSAALCGFALAKSLLRAHIVRLARRYPVLAAIDHAVKQGGLKTVLLLRLSPLLPSTFSNYLLGLTRLHAREFLLGSAIGTLPSSLLATYAGSGLHEIADIVSGRKSRSVAEEILFAIGLLATALLAGLLYRAARQELKRLLDQRAV